MKLKVQTLDAKDKGDVDLNDEIFGIEPRADILHSVVTWQLEKRRGTARGARERSDVARTGKKFGRQKGGGTARHGDRRAPIFVGGGKAHGPRVRDFNPSLNKKIRSLGLNSKEMQVEVTIGVQRPDKVDAAAVQASLPHGQVTVKVVKGGLDVPEDDRDDIAMIASAAVAVRFELP